jgi:hypothetical protein
MSWINDITNNEATNGYIKGLDYNQNLVRNVARYTEDLSWSYHFENSVKKTGQLKWALVDGRPMLFSRITGDAFLAYIEDRFSVASLTPFIANKKYLISIYTYSKKWPVVSHA